MIVLTGHSHKLDGICFVADTDDHATALKMLRDSWNATYADQMKLVIAERGDYLIQAELDAECVEDFEDETPRREGFILHANPSKAGVVIEKMPW